MKLCVIPARGGSKRIPRKNIKDFLGRPMISYSIEAALSSGCFDKIIVSTEDPEIAEVAMSLGALVPFVRPQNIADDFATTASVIKHAVEWFEHNGQEPSEICCLYATAPLIALESLRESYAQFSKSNADYCFSATTYGFPIQRAIKIDAHSRVEMFSPDFCLTRSQDLEEAYHDAGQFYWGTAEAWKSQKKIFSMNSTVYLLPSYKVQDIDTQEDWIRAEIMFKALQTMGAV